MTNMVSSTNKGIMISKDILSSTTRRSSMTRHNSTILRNSTILHNSTIQPNTMRRNMTLLLTLSSKMMNLNMSNKQDKRKQPKSRWRTTRRPQRLKERIHRQRETGLIP